MSQIDLRPFINAESCSDWITKHLLHQILSLLELRVPAEILDSILSFLEGTNRGGDSLFVLLDLDLDLTFHYLIHNGLNQRCLDVHSIVLGVHLLYYAGTEDDLTLDNLQMIQGLLLLFLYGGLGDYISLSDIILMLILLDLFEFLFLLLSSSSSNILLTVFSLHLEICN